MRMKPQPAPPRRRAFVAREASSRAPLPEAPAPPRARTLGLNLSQVVERALAAAIREAEQGRWLAENERAIEQYNAFVERHGAFGDEHRGF